MSWKASSGPSFRDHEEFYLGVYGALGRVLQVPKWLTMWVNLSSPVGTDQSTLTDRHRELARRVQAMVGPLEYIGVRTREGNGVIHALWVFPTKDGKRVRFSSYQKLSALWSDVLPGALNSRFRVVGGLGDDAIRLARYVAGQRGYVRSFRSTGWDGLVEVAGVVGDAKGAEVITEGGDNGEAICGV